MHDPVNHPQHYTKHKSGVECIQITEHMSFTLGNAIKYIWRADLKNGIEDLEKAKWYLEREIAKRKLADTKPTTNQSTLSPVTWKAVPQDLQEYVDTSIYRNSYASKS